MATEWLKSITTRYLNSRYKGCFHNVFQCVYRWDSRPVSNALVWISAPSKAHVSHTQISVKRNGTCSDNTCIVSCVGIGSPLPTVKWMKHNKDVSRSSSKPVYQIITKINETARQSNLVLSKVNRIRVLSGLTIGFHLTVPKSKLKALLHGMSLNNFQITCLL